MFKSFLNLKRKCLVVFMMSAYSELENSTNRSRQESAISFRGAKGGSDTLAWGIDKKYSQV